MKYNTLLMLVGLPASGKTTYAKEWVKKPNRVRFNRDSMREMMAFTQWMPGIETLITDVQNAFIDAAMKRANDIILDNTNLKISHINDMKERVVKFNSKKDIKFKYKLKFMYFNVPVEECIKRDKLREHPVGEKVILRMNFESADLISKLDEILV